MAYDENGCYKVRMSTGIDLSNDSFVMSMYFAGSSERRVFEMSLIDLKIRQLDDGDLPTAKKIIFEGDLLFSL